MTEYCILITRGCPTKVNAHFQRDRQIDLRVTGIQMKKEFIAAPELSVGLFKVTHSPKLYHMSRIRKPSSFLMSPYLGRRS